MFTCTHDVNDFFYEVAGKFSAFDRLILTIFINLCYNSVSHKGLIEQVGSSSLNNTLP